MKKYTISDGAGTQAVILPEKGATVISLTRGGEEFLYRDPENLASGDRPRCGIPFLFPIFGRLENGRYSYQGKTYAMDIHGFAHTSVWQVAEHTPDTLRLQLEADGRTLSEYPFRFRVTLSFQVAEGMLRIHQLYENLDEKPMPYSFGFHPYFRVENLENAQVETTAGMYFDYTLGKPAGFGHYRVGLAIPEGSGEAGAAFDRVQSPTVLHIPQEGRRVTMAYEESTTKLVLWTQAGKPFLCAEPINGTPNGLNTGSYLTLEPGQRQEAVLQILIELT